MSEGTTGCLNAPVASNAARGLLRNEVRLGLVGLADHGASSFAILMLQLPSMVPLLAPDSTSKTQASLLRIKAIDFHFGKEFCFLTGYSKFSTESIDPT